jgi:AmmeMemoRadiSam system protein B/AmmeMemoRadiSam system protein A
MEAVHISPYAGSWYPGHAEELDRLLAERFEQSSDRTGAFPFSEALAVVTPHAGPMYSGTVAAAAYRALQQSRPERIVVLAFPHHGGLRGAAVPAVKAIQTPLGEVPIDQAFLADLPRVAEDRVCDHSFEIQLPFLQKAAGGARVTPVYVGPMAADERERVAAALARAWTPGTVFVASSDFTHYGRNFGYTPFPADESIARRLQDLDQECMDAAGSVDSELFWKTLQELRATVCGADPIALLLETLSGLGGGDIYQADLDYQTSGEITGDYQHSVSYAALAYCRREAFDLDAADREALLDSAAETLRRLRDTGDRQAAGASGSLALNSYRGLFVSLHQGEELLGCIGNCTGHKPLAIAAGELALSAALDDPRFRPAAEVSGPIDIEISVLTPMKRIASVDRLRLGKHGAYLRLGGHAGLLLPQVGEAYDWTPEQFLSAVARKSTLGPLAWRDPNARLYVFEAQVFSRPGLPGRS